MKKSIKELQDQIELLKKALIDLDKETREFEKTVYELQPHKEFKAGDIVTDGVQVLLVRWTENKSLGITNDEGYMGCQILNGSRGFNTFRRDDFELDESKFFEYQHQIVLMLSGIEILEVLNEMPYKNYEGVKKLRLYLENLKNSKNA